MDIVDTVLSVLIFTSLIGTIATAVVGAAAGNVTGAAAVVLGLTTLIIVIAFIRSVAGKKLGK